MSVAPSLSTHPLPPSPSWRSVLHPNRHIGRSVQYRRGERVSQRYDNIDDNTDDTNDNDRSSSNRRRPSSEQSTMNHRWSSLMAPTNAAERSNQRLVKQSQDDSHFYLPPFSSSASRMLHSNHTLASSPPSPDRFRRGSRSNNDRSSSSSSNNRQPPPFLIIALLKLTEVLPVYCQLIATGPSMTSAAQACAILDGVVATASPSSSPVMDTRLSPHQSSHVPWHPSQQQQRPMSPLTVQYWMSKQMPLSSSSSLHSPTASALAMEGEWGTLVAPFLLLAAAEAMTADMQHVRTLSANGNTTTTATSSAAGNQKTHTRSTAAAAAAVALTGLYQRIRHELERIHEVLCEPFLRPLDTTTTTTTTTLTTTPPPTTTRPHQQSHAAATLALAIQQLIVIIAIRCQMIDLQATLFADTSVTDVQEHGTEPTGATDNGNGNHKVPTGLPTLAEASTAVSLYLESIEMASQRARSDREGERVHDTHADSNEPRPLVGPMFDNMAQELKAWKYCFETIAALEQCRFLETIVHLRQWQRHVPTKASTRLGQWMHTSLQETISLLPIYFDRVHAFATPFYGFDTAALWQQPPPPPPPTQGSSRNHGSSNTTASTSQTHRTDWNAIVTDFLRRQEKLGGPPMAVALVLNAAETANLHVERGFRLGTTDADSQSEHDVTVRWPAIYLRSTVHLSSSLHSSQSSPHNSGVMRLSQSSILSNWSTSGASSTSVGNSSPFVIGGRKRPTSASSPVPSQRKGGIGATVQQHHFSALEYAPDTGMATSWPHSDWDLFVASTLEKESQAENPISGELEQVSRSMEEDDETSDAMEDDPVLGVFSVSLPLHTNRFLLENGIKTFGRQSTFHTIGIGAWIHLVVIVKDKADDSRWHRRKTGLDDNEIQTFLLDVLKPKLSAMGIFSSPKQTPVLDHGIQGKQLVLPSNSGTSWADESMVQEFLTTVKQVFGLRPVSPYAKDATRSFSFYTPRSPRVATMNRPSERRGSWTKRQTSHDESATAFFLGPDLASSVDSDCRRFATSILS